MGKTTLALEVANTRPSLYLDLESERDRAKLDQAELYLADHLDKLVILDEVHRAPGLFMVLRGLLEVGPAQFDALWVRGGFPDSLQASSSARSLRWRQDFIRTYLERDVPQFGPRIAAQSLRLLWTLLAQQQGGMLNTTQLGRNLGKRLVKTPKLSVRDSGLVHALLDLGDKEAVLSHPIVGASWEGFCMENLLACAPGHVLPCKADTPISRLRQSPVLLNLVRVCPTLKHYDHFFTWRHARLHPERLRLRPA